MERWLRKKQLDDEGNPRYVGVKVGKVVRIKMYLTITVSRVMTRPPGNCVSRSLCLTVSIVQDLRDWRSMHSTERLLSVILVSSAMEIALLFYCCLNLIFKSDCSQTFQCNTLLTAS